MNIYPPDHPLHKVYSIYLQRRRLLIRHQERYIKAWIASTGVEPGDAILLHQVFPNGSEMIKIISKKDYEETRVKLAEEDKIGKFMFQYL